MGASPLNRMERHGPGWQSEARGRIVDPVSDGFQLDDFPDGYAYIASEWNVDIGSPIILVEKYN